MDWSGSVSATTIPGKREGGVGSAAATVQRYGRQSQCVLRGVGDRDELLSELHEPQVSSEHLPSAQCLLTLTRVGSLQGRH